MAVLEKQQYSDDELNSVTDFVRITSDNPRPQLDPDIVERRNIQTILEDLNYVRMRSNAQNQFGEISEATVQSLNTNLIAERKLGKTRLSDLFSPIADKFKSIAESVYAPWRNYTLQDVDELFIFGRQLKDYINKLIFVSDIKPGENGQPIGNLDELGIGEQDANGLYSNLVNFYGSTHKKAFYRFDLAQFLPKDKVGFNPRDDKWGERTDFDNAAVESFFIEHAGSVVVRLEAKGELNTGAGTMAEIPFLLLNSDITGQDFTLSISTDYRRSLHPSGQALLANLIKLVNRSSANQNRLIEIHYGEDFNRLAEMINEPGEARLNLNNINRDAIKKFVAIPKPGDTNYLDPKSYVRVGLDILQSFRMIGNSEIGQIIVPDFKTLNRNEAFELLKAAKPDVSDEDLWIEADYLRRTMDITKTNIKRLVNKYSALPDSDKKHRLIEFEQLI